TTTRPPGTKKSAPPEWWGGFFMSYVDGSCALEHGQRFFFLRFLGFAGRWPGAGFEGMWSVSVTVAVSAVSTAVAPESVDCASASASMTFSSTVLWPAPLRALPPFFGFTGRAPTFGASFC